LGRERDEIREIPGGMLYVPPAVQEGGKESTGRPSVVVKTGRCGKNTKKKKLPNWTEVCRGKEITKTWARFQ